MTDVTIRFRKGEISREEAASNRYVVAASPDDPSGGSVLYAFERDSEELRNWAARHGVADLLTHALDAVRGDSPESVDREALVARAEAASEPVRRLAEELGAGDSAPDVQRLMREGKRRGLIETVTLFSGAFYQTPFTLLPGSIPDTSWLGSPQVWSAYSTREMAFLYDQPGYGPNRTSPRAIVWPNSGIPYLGFSARSVYVY